MTHPQPDIHIHIDRLVLDGLSFDRVQSGTVQAALESELTRLLAAGGLASGLQAGGALPSIRAEGVQLSPSLGPAQMGTQIAQSVYGGLGSEA